MAITFRPGQYTNLGAFLTKITVKAVAKIDEGSADSIMRIAENVTAWATANIITSEQVDEIAAALPETEPNVPSELDSEPVNSEEEPENEPEISPGGDETPSSDTQE